MIFWKKFKSLKNFTEIMDKFQVKYKYQIDFKLELNEEKNVENIYKKFAATHGQILHSINRI